MIATLLIVAGLIGLGMVIALVRLAYVIITTIAGWIERQRMIGQIAAAVVKRIQQQQPNGGEYGTRQTDW